MQLLVTIIQAVILVIVLGPITSLCFWIVRRIRKRIRNRENIRRRLNA